MKVLAAIVVPSHLSVSGAARAALELSSALAPHCDISVASMMGDVEGYPAVSKKAVRTWLPPIVPWSRLPNKFSTLFYRSDLPDLIAQGDYDLVHLHNPMPALELERVALACRARNIPYVVSTHGFNEVANGKDVYGFGLAKKWLWEQAVSAPVARVVRGAAGIFALSPADVTIVRDMGFDGSNLSVVKNGVAVPAQEDSERDAKALHRLGIPDAEQGQITCMFLANHTPNKGLPTLLEAFSSLERPYLLIVGGENRSAINYEKYVRSCRPGQQIVVTGRVSDDDVAALFRRSDLFVFPTLADTFPLVVLEAMAHGVPVLASDVGGIPHQVDEGCGKLIAPGRAEAITAAVEELASNPRRLIEMGVNARARVSNEFTWEKSALDAMKGYGRVLEGCARPSAQSSPQRFLLGEQGAIEGASFVGR